MLIKDSLSYDDVLLVPAYADFLPAEANIRSRLVGDIYLNVPILSAAMDTVTENEMAIGMALEGGAGVIHRNLSPELQAEQVSAVKRYLNWIIENPITVHEEDTIADVKKVTGKYHISGLPVLDNRSKLCGIITNRDMRFCSDDSRLVKEVMTRNPHVLFSDATASLATEKFDTYKIEKLPVVDKENRLIGLITVKDIEKHQSFPQASLDKQGRLIVGAAISPNDWQKRVPLLIESKVDFVVLDTAHGDSKSVMDAIIAIKKQFNILIIGGNVATRDGALRIIQAGADAVKVGVGPGSICTTRIIGGIGMPQFTAVYEAAKIADEHNIPVIADGGIKFSGDIVKGIAAGASTVMLGNLLAGLKQSPGREILYDGRMFKEYRGMGSVAAIKQGSGDRYQMKEGDAAVPEGIEGKVPYKGELSAFLYQLLTGLKKGMGYVGCRNIDQLRKYKKFVRISSAGLRESHSHDVSITQEAPNYSRQY